MVSNEKYISLDISIKFAKYEVNILMIISSLINKDIKIYLICDIN